MPLTSPFPSHHIDYEPLHSYVLKAMQRWEPDSIAMVDFGSGKSYTFQAIRDLADQMAHQLQEHGLKKGDVVTFCLPNCAECAYAMLAVLSRGGVVSGLSPELTEVEMRNYIKRNRSCFILTRADLLLKIALAMSREESPIKKIFIIDPLNYDMDITGMKETIISLLLDGSVERRPLPPVDFDIKQDLALLPFSSGTTGLPKAVMISHMNFTVAVQNCYCNESIAKPGYKDAIIAFLPFFHIYGAYMLFTGLAMGQKLIVMPKFKLASFLQLIQTVEATKAKFLYIVPPVLKYLLKDPLVDNYDLSSVEYLLVGGAHLGKEVIHEALARFPHVLSIQQGYGMTETTCASHIVPIHPIQRKKAGSCGTLMPNFECKVVDTVTGAELHEFQRGEICVRGETCCLGYFQDPEATGQLYDSDSWLHTGDIGYYDNDQFFYVIERKKDLIKVNCYQVSPAELEDLLIRHPKIRDAAVIGIPDEDTEETPYAFAVPTDGSLTAADVVTYLNARVAPYKRIRKITNVAIVASIPKLPSGKIIRRLLRSTAGQV